jgi:hypothetical protein
MCGSDVGSLPISDHREIRQIAVVAQQHIQLNGTFGLTVISPWKQAQTKVHRCGVKTEQLVFEAKLSLFTGTFVMTIITHLKESVLIKLPGTVSIKYDRVLLAEAPRNPR